MNKFFMRVICVMVLVALHKPGIAADPADLEADKIVLREMPLIKSANTVESLNRLRIRYTNELQISDYPEAYECLLGIISPKNSPQAFDYLRRACHRNEYFIQARLAYGQSLRWRHPNTSERMIEEAWLADPANPDAVRAYASLLLERGNVEEARAAIEPFLLENAPEKEAAIGSYLEGRIAWQQQNWNRAEAALGEALKAMPFDTEVRSWWIRYAVHKGNFPQAVEAAQQRVVEPFDYAQLSVALADAMNEASRRELAPAIDPPPLKSTIWRDQAVKGYDAARDVIPYTIAWDMQRLAQWNDAAKGNLSGAWDRFEERIPVSLSVTSPSESASKYQAVRQGIESVSLNSPQALESLAEAMDKAGWTSEAIEVTRQAMQSEPSPSLTPLLARLYAHQGHLLDLYKSFASYPAQSLAKPPQPALLSAVETLGTERHPVSGAESKDPQIRYLREHNQYLSWMSEPWEKRCYRLMMILMEDEAFPVGAGKLSARVNVVLGEDQLPPAGRASNEAGITDMEKKDHCHVSISCEALLHDLYVQQADWPARTRLEAHFQSNEPWKRFPFIVNNDDFSPDTLAVIAQRLFQTQNLVPAANQSGAAMPPPAECRALRERIIEGLADYLTKREGFKLAIAQRAVRPGGNKDVKVGAYAIAYSRWPYLAYYAAYRDALNGDGQSRAVIRAILKEARNEGMIRDDQPPLLQGHWLNETQVRTLATNLFRE